VSKAIDTIAKLERVATDGSNLTPAGTVAYFPATTPPAGWLKANGQLVSRTTYAALFAVIGTTYGAGDGTTTFALPDLRGEFVRGWDDGRGVDSGRGFGSSQGDAFASHTHQQTHNGGAGGQTNQMMGGAGSIATTAASNLTLSTGGTETRPRNVALLACIKT
jgi:microcystin-dependent protein